MPISWNEIRTNAITFAHEWTGARSEAGEKQTFWDAFFAVFGVRRRLVATFEESVKKITGDYARIDLFWPGMLLVEHKSLGSDLGKAQSQAFRYIQDLLAAGRGEETPRYVIVSDFARIALHDLESEDQKSRPLLGSIRTNEFPLAAFHQHIHDFAFIPGYKQHKFDDPDPINIKAVAILGDLHDALESGGYKGHELERFLVRVLFCLFAEDTGIFEREGFRLYIENRTQADGTDLGPHLARLFEVLNTAPEHRQKNLDETLAAFPYVNGELFAEKLGFADFNRDMRNAMLACTHFDWSRISPAIFGSLFQAVMEPRHRRQIGGHYTSERDILKVVRSLFLDELRDEFHRIGNNKAQLRRFHEKISKLRFLDPACGCGNFLVITYRELRLLEIEILQALKIAPVLELKRLSLLDVDAFYGIEISEWPARIAEVAMWLMDHQMNLKLSEAFGEPHFRLPLRKSPTIVCGNAMRLDWKQILPPGKCSYVLGNPPFVGAKFQTPEQREDMELVSAHVHNHGLLDYVTGWYFKAAEYIKDTRILVGFVSTNSITQGEQVGVFWNAIFQRYGIKIHFAHRTFAWESEARGKAHVHVVIIGLGNFDATNKRIYDYEADKVNPTVANPGNISPYLVEGQDKAIANRTTPISKVPDIRFGNQPIDGGHLLLEGDEKAQLLAKEPEAKRFIRLFLGAHEFINGQERWCLWLHGIGAAELRSMPEVMRRVECVRKYRLASRRAGTRELAKTPSEFAFISHPERRYLLIPSVSSEKRHYIPMGFMPGSVIASNLCLVVPDATPYHFGVLSSAMHMAWVRQVCGRLESRYRYSNKLVYNNYPWPDDQSAAKRARVEEAAQRILDLRVELGDGRYGFLPTRKKHGRPACLADLYDPLAMPAKLVKAHASLDRAVDLCYRPQPFATERHRVEFLFALYEKLTAPLIPSVGKKKRRAIR